jgi:hypothetical protein
MEIVMRDKRIQQLQKSMNDASADLVQCRTDLSAYEKQCNSKSTITNIRFNSLSRDFGKNF